MYDYKVSVRNYLDDACRQFSLAHNVTDLAKKVGMQPATLRNKLNPDQSHQLTLPELLTIIDLTEDPTILEGFLRQINCQPSVPVSQPYAPVNRPAHEQQRYRKEQPAGRRTQYEKFTCHRQVSQHTNPLSQRVFYCPSPERLRRTMRHAKARPSRTTTINRSPAQRGTGCASVRQNNRPADKIGATPHPPAGFAS